MKVCPICKQEFINNALYGYHHSKFCSTKEVALNEDSFFPMTYPRYCSKGIYLEEKEPLGELLNILA